MIKKQIHVAVGILFNGAGEILIARRPEASHQGGLWEFPGGKVEKNESVFGALKREFLEEVAINIIDAQSFISIEHDYGDKKVLLDVWSSSHFKGEAKGLEGQQIQWVEPEKLKDLSFPAANIPIIEKLLAAATETPKKNTSSFPRRGESRY